MKRALIIHGGGLVDPSKDVIMRIAGDLWEQGVYDKVYMGRYSFMSMYDHTLWMEYDEDAEDILADVRGTFFGTCRGIDMTEPKLLERSLNTLQEYQIKTVIVCGGDGSSRNCAEISEAFQKRGINIIFAIPLTVDGINGGISIGLEQAVREAVRQIENVVATSLLTRDKGEFSVVAVELQGRNRNDILATVLQHFDRQEKIADYSLRYKGILLRVVPANFDTDDEALIKEINSSKEPTLVILSEGAKLKMSELIKKVTRKVRTVNVGHAVQSNGMTTLEDMEKYDDWLTDVTNFIADDPLGTYCIVNDGISRWKELIDYYAKLNPREGQTANLSKGLELLLKKYMV